MGRSRGRKMRIIGKPSIRVKNPSTCFTNKHVLSKPCLITQGYGAANAIAYRGRVIFNLIRWAA